MTPEEAELELELSPEPQEQQELGPLSCDHEFETVDRLDKDTILQVCLVCDAEREVYKLK